jgi:hypothetical protein
MLTTAQLQALKAAIDADPVLSAQPLNSDGAFFIAAALNQEVAPAFVVWRTSVPLEEITSNGFAWTLVDALSAGSARIWEWMFDNSSRSINPSKANIRQGIADVWSGTAGKLAVQASVLGHCKRNATRAEKILATGTGTTESPAAMGFEGALSYQEIETARNL